MLQQDIFLDFLTQKEDSMLPKTAHEAARMGWQIFQFNFTDGSSERIASLIRNDSLPITYLVENNALTESIDDDAYSTFFYPSFFNRTILGLIEEKTDEFL